MLCFPFLSPLEVKEFDGQGKNHSKQYTETSHHDSYNTQEFMLEPEVVF